MAGRLAIPSFALYGEPPGGERPRPDPVHLEALLVRAPAHHWEIRPHRHNDLHQIFWISGGGGSARVEEAERAFDAPCLLLLPPGTVHGFTFRPGSEGQVLSLTGAFVAAQETVFGRVDWLHRDWVAPVPPERAGAIRRAFEAVRDPYERHRSGRHMAVAGAVLSLWPLLQAMLPSGRGRAGADPALILLVERYVALIEGEYRAHRPLAHYAACLGVSPARLARACREVAGRTPLGLVHERLLLEARRLLAYTGMGIADISHELGFSDPAYFSRFFGRRYGLPPSGVRKAPS